MIADAKLSPGIAVLGEAASSGEDRDAASPSLWIAWLATYVVGAALNLNVPVSNLLAFDHGPALRA